MRMSRDSGGWTRTECGDFKPKDKYGREGPRHKELPGGTDGAVFRKRKRLFDAPKLRETSKQSMRKKRELERQGGKKQFDTHKSDQIEKSSTSKETAQKAGAGGDKVL